MPTRFEEIPKHFQENYTKAKKFEEDAKDFFEQILHELINYFEPTPKAIKLTSASFMKDIATGKVLIKFKYPNIKPAGMVSDKEISFSFEVDGQFSITFNDQPYTTINDFIVAVYTSIKDDDRLLEEI